MEFSEIFMKESPIKTINSLIKDFIGEIIKNDIFKSIIGLNLKEINGQDYEAILEFLRKLINKYNDNNMNNTKENGEKISMINNLHNLYIYFYLNQKN